jgi:Domain of unknown function (DUF4190)
MGGGRRLRRSGHGPAWRRQIVSIIGILAPPVALITNTVSEMGAHLERCHPRGLSSLAVVDQSGWRSPDGQWLWDGRQWLPVDPSGFERKTSPLAVASLVSSLILPLWPISSIAAIVLGVVALRQIRRSVELGGRGLAMAGIVVGAAVLALVTLALLAILWFGYQCRNGC